MDVKEDNPITTHWATFQSVHYMSPLLVLIRLIVIKDDRPSVSDTSLTLYFLIHFENKCIGEV